MGAGIGRKFDPSVVEVKTIKVTPPKLPFQDREDNLVYMLKKEFEISGQFGQSEIIAVSTDKQMIFSMAKVLAQQDFYKPKVDGRELGKWDFIVLIYDNESGKFLDKVEIPRFHE